MVWGINDFDEAFSLPYTNDIVRLATSALLARDEGHLAISLGEMCDAILTGYRNGLEEGGRPFVLAERNKRFRSMVKVKADDAALFWQKMDGLDQLTGPLSERVRKVIDDVVPKEAKELRITHRVAGVGSLGCQRIAATGEWKGGKFAREIKALALSAALWTSGSSNEYAGEAYRRLLHKAVRSPDPFV